MLPWSKKREDHDVETGGPAPSRSSSCSSSSTVKPSSLARQLDKETNIVLTMKSIERGLQIITICISILYCATLALSSRQQQQQLGSKQEQQVPPMSNIAPFSTMRRFKKPPTLKQMYKSRNCESYFTQITADGKRIDSTSLPIYTKKEWEYFRKVWRDQGGQDPSKLYKLNSRRRSKAPPDFFPPFKAGQTKDGKGRGVFATRDIKKGELTYGGTKNYIFFNSGHDYRRFLDALDDEAACDIMKFTWPQWGIGRKGEAVIMGAMDDNAFMNDGGPERANTGCLHGKNCGMFDEYALRDIKEGEELLCDYGEFFSHNFLKFKLWKRFRL